MSVGVFELLVGALVVAAILLALAGGLGRWEPARWALAVGLQITPRNESFVRSYITRTRRLRLLGAATAVLAALAYAATAQAEPPEPFDFALFDALLGYLIGAVVAEITVSRPRSSVPSASLVPRDVAAYLPAGLRTAFRVSAVVAVLLIPLYLTLPDRERDVARVDMLPSVLVAAMIVIVLVGVELLQRYIVRRPQPAVDEDLLRADDAVRSASVHALAGAGIALELLIVAVELGGIGFVSDIQVLRWTLPWLGMGCFVASILAWVRITHPRRWRVRREPRAGEVRGGAGNAIGAGA
jgi:hypothetical protein